MAVPKSILLHLKRRPQRIFSQKLILIKASFLRNRRSKYTGDDLWRNLYCKITTTKLQSLLCTCF